MRCARQHDCEKLEQKICRALLFINLSLCSVILRHFVMSTMFFFKCCFPFELAYILDSRRNYSCCSAYFMGICDCAMPVTLINFIRRPGVPLSLL